MRGHLDRLVGWFSACAPLDKVRMTGQNEVIAVTGTRCMPQGCIDLQVNGAAAIFSMMTNAGTRCAPFARDIAGTDHKMLTLLESDTRAIGRRPQVLMPQNDGRHRRNPGSHLEGPFISRSRRGLPSGRPYSCSRQGTIGRTAGRLFRRRIVHGDSGAPDEYLQDLCRPSLGAGNSVCRLGQQRGVHDTLTRAIDEGLSGVTHLLNASRHEEPGTWDGRGPYRDDEVAQAASFSTVIHVDRCGTGPPFQQKNRSQKPQCPVIDAITPTVGTEQDHSNAWGRQMADPVRHGRLVSEKLETRYRTATHLRIDHAVK